MVHSVYTRTSKIAVKFNKYFISVGSDFEK